MNRLSPVAFADFFAFARSHRLLLVVCFAAFLASGATGLTNPILSLYPREYEANTFLVGLFMTSFAIGRVLITMPTGRLADVHGSRTLMLVGAAFDGLGALCLALAPSYPFLVAARLLQGVGSGLFMSAATVLVAQLSNAQDRGRITSLFQGSIFLGLTVTPFIGGMLADAVNLRAPILGYAALEGGVVLLVLLCIPRLNTTPPSHAMPDASSTIVSPAQTSGAAVRSLLANRDFVLIALVAFLIFVGRSGARDTLLPIYGETIVGLDAADLGIIFTLLSLMNLLAIPVAGMLADKHGRKLPILIGLLLNSASVLMLGAGVNDAFFVMSALLMGVAKGFSEPTSTIYVTDIASPGLYGTTFGLFLTLRDVGLLIGPVALSAIADLGGLQMSYLVSGAAFVVVAVIFTAARETRVREREQR